MSTSPTGPSLRIREVEPADVPALLTLVIELAEYERLAHLVTASEEDYQRALFGPDRHARAALAEWDGDLAGYMVWFKSFSTFKAKSKLYLEDLYVRPSYRGRGIGIAMLAELAGRCLEEGLPRMQWQVLDWNTPSIDFYRNLGAGVAPEWLDCTLDGAPLAALAARRPARSTRV